MSGSLPALRTYDLAPAKAACPDGYLSQRALRDTYGTQTASLSRDLFRVKQRHIPFPVPLETFTPRPQDRLTPFWVLGEKTQRISVNEVLTAAAQPLPASEGRQGLPAA